MSSNENHQAPDFHRNEDLFQKVEDACDRFLMAYTKESLPEVAVKAMEPITKDFGALLLVGHGGGCQCVPMVSLAKRKVPPPAHLQHMPPGVWPEIHILMDDKSNYYRAVAVVVGPGVFAPGQPQQIGIDVAIGMGFTPYDMVQGIKEVLHESSVHQMATQHPATA